MISGNKILVKIIFLILVNKENSRILNTIVLWIINAMILTKITFKKFQEFDQFYISLTLRFL